MTNGQKIIKYCAIAFAIILVVAIISSILSLAAFFGLISDSDPIKDPQTIAVEGVIDILYVELEGVELEIVEGDSFSIESNYKHLRVKENGKKLSLEDKDTFIKTDFDNVKVKLVIPYGHVFSEIEIETGAGQVRIDTLSAKDLSLSLGAGEVEIGYLSATDSTEINGGAGRLIIRDGILTDLELAMGVGKTDIRSKLTGNCEIDQGIGEADIMLVGSKDDYKISIDKGIGSATIDGQLIVDDDSVGSGDTRLHIDGGIGSINVDFE